MPLRLVRSRSNATLWETCAGRFLDEVGRATGPRDFPAWMWIAHRTQRDSLFEMAAERGLRGWLAPPISFFSELRDLFRIEARPIGILTGRLLVARIAARVARDVGLVAAARERGPARAHMIDGVLSELLPEGFLPERLREALAELGGDDFAARRNHWVADTYESFLQELSRRDRYDPRSIHALVAERIERGELAEAIRPARALHLYGITSLRGRRRLVRSLAGQSEVDVALYLTEEEETSEWDGLGVPVEVADAPEGAPPRVQPTPDSVREAAWVARRVKQILVSREAAPHEVAIVARSGHEDTRKMHQALAAAGVPSTARIRTVLAEIPALKALLQLFRAEAKNWPYRDLRLVLTSPYLGPGVDLRAIDHLARTRRFEGLEEWEAALGRLRETQGTDRARALQREGVFQDRLEQDLPRFAAFRGATAPLRGPRAESAWIALTLEILDGRLFDFRKRLCDTVADRHDIVRLDQRGVLAVEALLREWKELLESEEGLASDERFGAEEWHVRLGRLLEANELALSTPLQTGVQILEAHEAALTPFRRLFVIHANDGVFPGSASSTGVFTDAERRRLAALGIPLSNRDESLRRERTLWRSATANGDVTITYRTTDANGIPRLPSPMVPKHSADTELPRTLDPAAGDVVRSADGEVASPAQLLAREAHRLSGERRSGDRTPFHTPEPAALRHAVLNAFAEELRAGALDGLVRSERGLVAGGAAPSGGPDPASVLALDRPISERPSAWNGRLRDPAVLAVLRERFAERYAWSASQLETYGRRPFDFLLERVLYLGEVEEAEEETTPLAFGSVAHALLQRFYERVKDDLPVSFDAGVGALYRQVTEEVFAEFEADLERWLGLPALWAVSREDVRDRVREYLTWELEYLAKNKEVPFLIEHEFGMDGTAGGLEVSGRDAGGAPASLLLRGRIDRVDRVGSDARERLRVIDYKSSQAPKCGGRNDGALLQSALYLRVLEQLGVGRVGSAVYRAIKKPGEPQNACELKPDGIDLPLGFALSIPPRVRAGLFEPVQAQSNDIADWQPGREVTRTTAKITTATRFHPVSE